jgi:hypothetical protein
MSAAERKANYKAEADKLATERGGMCLSETVPTLEGRVQWSCNIAGHDSWFASLKNVRGNPRKPRGTWCPACGRISKANTRRFNQGISKSSIRKAEADCIAAERGGWCLSEEIRRDDVKIRWKCKTPEHREWSASLSHVRGTRGRKGSWCRECFETEKLFDQEKVRKALLERRILLKSRYNGSRKPIQCECIACGHHWTDSWTGIMRRAHACPNCEKRARGQNRKLPLDKVRALLESRGIELLSDQYANNHSKLHIRFKRCGHVANMTFNDLLGGHRCAKCSAFFCERQCKYAAETLFGVKFEKYRPADLRGVGNRPLEFDIYNAELQFAIEHNGVQHYSPQEVWGGQKAFERTVEHDRRKREYCSRKGITLVEIRDLGEVTPWSELKRIIKDACIAGGVPLPPNYDEIEIAYDVHDMPTSREGMWTRIVKRAEAAGYTLITKEYTSLSQRVELICTRGHHWNPSAHVLLYSKNLCHACKLEREQRPVVVFPLCKSASQKVPRTGLLFESINAAAKCVGGYSSHVASVADGKLPSVKGCGVAAVTREQVVQFKKNPSALTAFSGELIAASRWGKQPPNRRRRD